MVSPSTNAPDAEPAARRRPDSVAIVIPAQDAAAHLLRVLPAATALQPGGGVIVIDAGSTDETAATARAAGVQVRSFTERLGPSAARNAGVAETDAEIVIFLDADCVPRADVVERVCEAFAGEPDLVSLTGSYAAETPEPGFLSQYMNLRHHFTHQIAKREPATFWTGCGAVRHRAFLAVGGFDAVRFPNGMEDMELGLRLAEVGRTRLDPGLQVTHLKRWTLRDVLRAEIYFRAAPWARLIIERGHLPDDLNLRVSQRIAALVAPLALVACVLLPSALVMEHWLTAEVSAAVLASSIVLNLPMFRLFARLRGFRFAVGAWLFHQVHLVYSAATLVACVIAEPFRRDRAVAAQTRR